MYKLVIVDDEAKIRTGLMNHFPWQELGFQIAGDFLNAKTALDFIDKSKVDVVLTDIRMPVMNGIELAHTIYERNLNITVVFLSGYADFEYARQAIEYSVKHYILKPAKYNDIVSVFSNIRHKLDITNNKLKINDKPEGYYDKIVDIVMTYVAENLADATLDVAALKVNLSPNYLSKIFKQKTDKNFSEFLIEEKMKKAAEMMNDINLKMYHISSAVGYDNPKNFSRAFKQYFGKAPKEYRNKGM